MKSYKRTLLGSLLIVGALVACDKKDKDKEASKDTAASSTTAAKSAAAASAAAHLASNCDVAVRVDVGAFMAVPQAKAEIVTALEEMKSKEPKDDMGKRFEAFLTEAGIDPLKDIKDVAVCLSDFGSVFEKKAKEPNFAIVMGGNFKPGTIVPALLKHVKDEKKDKMKEEEIGGVKALTDEKGEAFVGQATDGAIIIAKSKPSFEAALKTGDAASSKYQLPGDAVSVVVTADFLKLAAKADANNPLADKADKMGRAAFTVDLGSMTMKQRIAMADDKAATEVAGVLKMLLGQVAKQPAVGDPMDAMIMDLVKDAKIDSQGTEVIIELKVPSELVDKMVKELAENIRKGKM
jgi:hypothetical protein